MPRPVPVSVVETPEFLASVRAIMDEEERGLLVDYLAHNPLAGDLVAGTGGVRKLRWALEGRGKRGGSGGLLLSQRRHADLRVDGVRQERAGGHQSGGPQRFPPPDRAACRALCEEEKMTSKVADSIRRGLEEALVYAEGMGDGSRYGVHIPEVIDVKAIRGKLDMTQEEFAGRFGFSINTLRHWEQGRRIPEGPTRAYLLVIDRDPKAVQKALRAA